MRVGLVRNVALGMVALVGFGLAACDDNPTDFDTDDTVSISANPSVMTVPAGITTLLSSRTENAGQEPTWEEITASVDGTCGSGAITVDVAATYEPSIQPPGQFDVTGGNTMGEVCIGLSGGGANATVEVTVVGDSLDITGAPEFLNINESVDLGAVLMADDGTPIGPFDDATDVVWSSDNEDAITVDADGVATAVGVGGAVITATWSGFGVSVSNSVTILTNQPELVILNAPATLTIFATVDLDAEITNPTDPPADFGPFDPETDVVWTSSDATVVEVDIDTGEATAVGAGTATITAAWAENDAVFDEAEITVDVPAPTLTSTDVATADALDLVTITGTGFIPGAHIVKLDGAAPLAFYEATVVDATTATFLMPGGGAADIDITVGILGAESNVLVVSRTCGPFDDCASEPDNTGSPANAPLVTLPFSAAGIVDANDVSDFYRFDLAAETTLQMDLSWTGDSEDLDLLVVDAAFTAFQCDFVTATGDVPESGQCTLPAGSYAFWVDSFDLEAAVYQIDVVVVP